MKHPVCRVLICFALLMSVLFLLSSAPIQARPANRSVRIGVVDSVSQGAPASLMAIVMRPFKSYMEDQTGIAGDIVNGGDALTLAQRLHDDKVQVGIFHGHEFAWAKQKFPNLQPIVVCVSEQKSAKVHLVTLTTTKAKSFEDFKNKTIALARKNRDYCRLYFERKCLKAGVEAEKFYKKILTPLEPEQGMDAVVAGKAQAAVVDSISLAKYQKERPGRAKWLKIVQTSEPFPCGVIACYKDRFPEMDVAKFRDALINAHSVATGRKTLELFRLTSFEAAPENHDSLLEAINKAYPAPKAEK